MVNYCRLNGIIPELTNTYSSWENAVAERKNRTLMESARCMLIASDRPKYLWEDATEAACYVRNRTPCRTNPEWKTPFELRFNAKPRISHLKVWGCKAMVHIPSVRTSDKLSPRSRLCIFVGYRSPGISQAYTFVSDTGSYIYSANATFDELEIINRHHSHVTVDEAEGTAEDPFKDFISANGMPTTLLEETPVKKRQGDQSETAGNQPKRQSKRLMVKQVRFGENTLIEEAPTTRTAEAEQSSELSEESPDKETLLAFIANYLNDEPTDHIMPND